jgi:hypothetical protein
MVPLSALVNVKHASGPDSLDRFNNLPAVKIIGQTAPGISSGQGIARVEQIAKEVLPPDFSFDWGGSSYQEKKSSGASTFALGLAVVMVFLILAAQYEKWSLPLSVLLALPFGTFGALVAIWAKNLIGPFFHATPLTNDVYFQIGLVTLLGLAAKNAILIVEFAVLEARRGPVGFGVGDRGGPPALPADPDDLAGVHPRRPAAGHLDRRRCRRAAFGGHRRDGRHDRRDPARRLPRAAVLQGALRPAHSRNALARRAARRGAAPASRHPGRPTGAGTARERRQT